eukprot:55293-Prymnesium_polylepis.1
MKTSACMATCAQRKSPRWRIVELCSVISCRKRSQRSASQPTRPLCPPRPDRTVHCARHNSREALLRDGGANHELVVVAEQREHICARCAVLLLCARHRVRAVLHEQLCGTHVPIAHGERKWRPAIVVGLIE